MPNSQSYERVERSSMMLRVFSASWRWRQYWFPRKTVKGFKWLLDRIYFSTKPSGKVRVATKVGLMVLNCRDDVMVPAILATGMHEDTECKLLESQIQKGQTVLDIGANIGYFSLHLSACVGQTGKVYSFEPDPGNLMILMENLSSNNCDNVQVIQKALSSELGKVSLYRDEFNYGAHSLSSDNLAAGPKSEVEIEAMTLDSFLRKEGAHVDWIKMDIEGAEGLVLKGAQETLRKDHPSILMEFWPAGLERMGTDPLALLENLIGHGYQVWCIGDGGARLETDLPSVIRQARSRDYENLLLKAGARLQTSIKGEVSELISCPVQ